MALTYIDRVKETTTTTGTGTYTLAGAVTGFQAFSTVGNGNTCYYAASDGTNWEVGLGTYTLSGTTLARTSILASSTGSAINWVAGTRTIWVDFPAAAISAFLVASNNLSDVPSKPSARLNLTVPVYVTTRTAMKALDTTKDVVAYLDEAGREGMFVWRAGDYSSWVTADTLEGVYVKATAIASSVGAWVRNHHFGVVDVNWFGAVPDARYKGDGGVTNPGLAGIWYSDPAYTVFATDSTAGIQAAVNLCPTGVIRGGWVVNFNGSGYKISGTIATGVRRIIYRGEGEAGPHGTMICVEGGNQDWFVCTYDSTSFYNLVFQGPSAGTGSAIVLGTGTTLANRAFSGRIMNCYFVGVGWACVKLINAEDFHIIACTMEICQYGVLGVMADQNKIVNSTFYGCTTGGVYFQQGSDNTVIGNNFYLCAHSIGSGVKTQGAIIWNSAGVSVQSRDNIFANNTFDQNNVDISITGSVAVPSTNSGPNFFTISNNKSQFADAQSIYLVGPSNVMVTGNSIVDANNAGYATTAAVEMQSTTECLLEANTVNLVSANVVDYGLKVGTGNSKIRLGNMNRWLGGTGPISINSMPMMEFERVPLFANATMTGGNAVYDGQVMIDTTNNRLVWYSNGARYYVAGTAF